MSGLIAMSRIIDWVRSSDDPKIRDAGDRAVEYWNELLVKQDKQYTELLYLRGRLSAVADAFETLSGLTRRALDAAHVCRLITHFYVEGVCADCGVEETPRQ